MMRPIHTAVGRSRLVVTVAALIVTVFASTANASGPGANFPEQPGPNVAQACESILTNPDRALNFLTGEQHMSAVAAGIVVQQYIDACLGG